MLKAVTEDNDGTILKINYSDNKLKIEVFSTSYIHIYLPQKRTHDIQSTIQYTNFMN